MPRVMRCRQSQRNDRSNGSGLCGDWWVRKVPRLRPNGLKARRSRMDDVQKRH